VTPLYPSPISGGIPGAWRSLAGGWPSRSAGVGEAGGRADPEELKEAAAEFEALFVARVLDEMWRSATTASYFGRGFAATVYRDLFRDELARAVARSGGFGIADLLARRLSGG